MSKLSRITVPFLLASVVLVSCDGGSGSSAPAPTTASPSPTASTPAPSTPTVQTPAEPVREAATLKKALMGLKDLPSGFKVELEQPPADDGMSVSSKDPKCARLVRYFETIEPPGSRASTYRSFSRGQTGPYIDLRLDALGSANAVAALQTEYRSAVKSCPKLTLTIPGQGSSPVRVRELSTPQLGTGLFAARFTATAGELAGIELTLVTNGVDDVLLTMTYFAARGYDIDGVTKAAVEHAKAVLVREE